MCVHSLEEIEIERGKDKSEDNNKRKSREIELGWKWVATGRFVSFFGGTRDLSL